MGDDELNQTRQRRQQQQQQQQQPQEQRQEQQSNEENKKDGKQSHPQKPQKVYSIGHAGLGGSVVFAIPEMQLSVAITLNQLRMASTARKLILQLICKELGLKAPLSFIGGGATAAY